MGTGGGEVCLQLQAYWPEKVVVTKDYPPNVELATEWLSPFGVKVINVAVSGVHPMPFYDGEFYLILNRQTAFNSNEIARTLGQGGAFLTQQIHGRWA